MKLQQTACIDDLATLARRRLPAFAFDFLDGGAGDERGCRRNREGLQAVLIKPRFGVGVEPDTRATVFGQSFRLPFGVAPVGLGNFAWPGADAIIARLAHERGIPYVASTVSTTAIEEVAAAAPGNTWFQLYYSRTEAINRDLLRRAWEAGVRVLTVTIDIAAAGDRRRDVRNRFIVPFRPGLGLVADLMLHPQWSLNTLRAGPPSFPNLMRYANGAAAKKSLAEFIGEQIKGDLRWDDLRWLRDAWQGSLVVKGILAPEDAVMAREIGADAIWVSNHGGRQLDAAPASVDAIAGIRQAVGPDMPLFMDSGIRSGEDVVKARLKGADFVFTGRCFYYGAAAGGKAGVARALTLLTDDLRRTMIQIGCPRYVDLDDRWRWNAAAPVAPAKAEWAAD